MKKTDSYRWVVPSLVILGVILLSGGIFIGVKSYQTIQANNNQINKTNSKSLSSSQTFKLDDYCQIWLQEDDEVPVMLGKATKDLYNKTEDEIKEVLKQKYPDKEVSVMNKYQIILKTSDETVDLSKANKYTLENQNGYVSVFKYDKNGKKQLIEKTSIQIKSLPKSVQQDLKQVVILDNEDDAYSRLEDLES